MIDSVFIPRYAPSQEKVPKVLFNDGLRPCCGPVLWPSDDPDDPITNQFIWRGYVVTSARFYLDLSAVELADFDYAGSTYEFFRLKNQNEVLYWIGRPTPSTPETSGGPLYARALEGETASGGLRVELILAWDFETEVATVYAYPGIGDSETDRIFEWIFDFSPVDPYDQFSKFVAVDSSDGESGARLACWPRNMHALGDAQRAWPRVVTTGLGGLGVEIDPLSGAATVSPINAPNAKLLPGTWLNGGDRSYKVFDGGEIPTGNASRPSYWHGLSLSDDTITFSLRWYQWDASDDYVLMWIATYEAPISWADWVPDDDGHLEETKAATFVEKTFERSSSTPVLNKEPSSSVTFEALTGEPSEEAAEGVSTARGFSWSFSQLAPSEFLITPSASTITKDWFSGTGSAYPKFKVFASLNPASYVREGPDLSELQDSDPQSDWSGRIMGWMIVWQLDESEEEGEEGQDGEMGVHMLRLRANAVFNGFEAKCTIKAVSQWGVDISENGLVTFNVFEGSVLDPDPTLPVEIPNELSGNGGYNEEFDFYHYNVWAEGSITLTPATS